MQLSREDYHQMRLYALIRKSQHESRPITLNAIADRNLKAKKLEYPKKANIINIGFARVDFKRKGDECLGEIR